MNTVEASIERQSTELSAINATMANIDLIAEMLGPLAAGVTLDVLGGTLGFVVVGIANVLTFAVELRLLRSVYHARDELRAPKAAADDDGSGQRCDALGSLLRAACGTPRARSG